MDLLAEQAHQENLKILDELLRVLHAERKSLVTLDTAQAVLAITEKEMLLERLKRLKLKMKGFYQNNYERVSLKEIERHQEMIREWHIKWEDLCSVCESNQRFIKHSMRNFELISDNFKRLFGQHATYSAQGRKVDSKVSGKVVEASI